MPKIFIISKYQEIYSTQRLKEESERLGYTVKIINPENILLVNNLFFQLQNGTQGPPHFVISRVSSASDDLSLNLIYFFENLGIPVINSSQATLLTRNKFSTALRLAQQKIQTPKTVFLNNTENLNTALEVLGGFPVIIKLLRGAQGKGIMIAENIQTAKAIIDSLCLLSEGFLLQQYLDHEYDARLIVVNNTVISAMKRYKAPQDFRTNIKCNGTAQDYKPTEEEKILAIAASQACFTQFAGVDIIHNQVIEVNVSPGLEKIEQVTTTNIAHQIIQSMENICK